MEPVDPRIDTKLVPAGSAAFIVGASQPGYIPLPTVRTPLHHVITRWTLTDEERARVAAGEDIFLTIWAVGPVQPVYISVGPADWTK